MRFSITLRGVNAWLKYTGWRMFVEVPVDQDGRLNFDHVQAGWVHYLKPIRVGFKWYGWGDL